ncbi:putative lipid II flippase FtsW [Sphingomonas morindae]|uniref:Probable peptidoglycan glycosyltransferase FtsW n=1 Tax=Sphingomonas morindae TaxID=1541170 RepID=A0ABY4XC40_9SPHN|nr:putative peptidoglycan glycosyltransferase FtsW [Sphingomonas morindae]USI74482.1 putative lipid II flippase FtsW [Sphingomonas morindae]
MDSATKQRAARDRLRGQRAQRLGRADRSALGRWFWEIDLVLLALVTVLIGIGLIAVAAASPAAGVRYSGGAVQFPPLYYFYRQCVWLMVGVPVMFVVSMTPKDVARRLCLIGAMLCFLALAATPLVGHQVNGARRWIGSGMAQFQPSEFLKPLYVVAMAWLFSIKQKDRTLPVTLISGVITAAIAGILMKQPDFGQTIMFLLMWTALLTLTGAPMKGLVTLGLAGIGAVVAAYLFYPVATLRINNFLFQSGDTYQVDSARRTLLHGGLLGTGPGGGTAKFHLPEPHTDYIFSVIGEEFGLIACIAIALIYMAIVVRVFVKLLDEEDMFLTLAAAGLATQFGAQALINMAVNVQLAPSKGMTLPFISYGGSSLIALSMGFGLLLAFTRRNPYLTRSPYVVTWNTHR